MLKLASWAVVFLSLTPLLGCKSTDQPDHFKSITSDLDLMESQLKDVTYQMDSVTKSLSRFAAADGDLRKPLSEFQGSVAALDASSTRIRNLGADLKTKEAAFQSSWSDEVKAIESSTVRRTAEQGRADVAASFRSLDQQTSALGNGFREWESKVKSIQSSLETDLSPANQTALAGRIREATDMVPGLKEQIRRVSDTIDQISSSMKSTIR
jgi:chromosome segregation ATPase